MVLMNALKYQGLVRNTHELAKYVMDAGFFLHKRKDEGAQWIYHYTIHGYRS